MKHPEVCEQTRKDLIEAFWNLFAIKKLHRITVNEIVATAGYHRNTFYRYFNSVYDLLDQIEDSLSEDLIAYTNEKLVGEQRGQVKESYIHILENHDRAFTLLLRRDAETGFSRKLVERITPVLKKNFVFSDDPVRDDFIADYVANGSIAMIARFFSERDTFSAAGLVETNMGLITTGAWPISPRRKPSGTD